MLLHIANTQFEWELVQKKPPHLEESFFKHPIFLQLQFLPFLYAAKEDGVCVTRHPEPSFFQALERLSISPPTLHLLSDRDLPFSTVQSWGASESVSLWAKSRNLNYVMPPWEIVKQVNSKQFSFTKSPKLPLAKLLTSEEETLSWLKDLPGKKVLKTCFGVSGKGHLQIDSKTPLEKILLFLKREWNEGRAVIGEPWVMRKLDFSTQWAIGQDKQIAFLGSTLCENDMKGQYRSSCVGEEEKLFGSFLSFLTKHKQFALPILQEMAKLGYFGNVGIDAMVYIDEGEKLHLHPIVEINARKTMGWVSLEIQRLHFPKKAFKLHYSSGSLQHNLLPNALVNETPFSRSLVIDFDVYF